MVVEPTLYMYMHVIVSVKKTYNFRGMSVVVCTDVSGKEPHRQVGMGTVDLPPGSLDGVMVSTLAQNARGVDSIPALATIFPILNTPTT